MKIRKLNEDTMPMKVNTYWSYPDENEIYGLAKNGYKYLVWGDIEEGDGGWDYNQYAFKDLSSAKKFAAGQRFEKITNIPSVEKAEADMKAKKSEIDNENDRLAKAKATRETNMAKRAQLKGMDIQSYKKYTSSRRNVTAALNNVERLELELEKAKSYFDNIKSEFETEYGETYE